MMMGRLQRLYNTDEKRHDDELKIWKKTDVAYTKYYNRISIEGLRKTITQF
jgi:hypothetical protein